MNDEKQWLLCPVCKNKIRLQVRKDTVVLVSSVVVASASIFKTISRVVILSLRFSFFKPFRFLYPLVVIPDHALVISSVRIAYSTPFCIP